MGWRDDEVKTRWLLPYARGMLGAHLGGGEWREERVADIKFATDLVSGDGVNCAAMRLLWQRRFWGKATVRARRPSGVETEYDKLKVGRRPRWYVLAHGDEALKGRRGVDGVDRLLSLYLLDLDRCVDYLVECCGELRGTEEGQHYYEYDLGALHGATGGVVREYVKGVVGGGVLGWEPRGGVVGVYGGAGKVGKAAPQGSLFVGGGVSEPSGVVVGGGVPEPSGVVIGGGGKSVVKRADVASKRVSGLDERFPGGVPELVRGESERRCYHCLGWRGFKLRLPLGLWDCVECGWLFSEECLYSQYERAGCDWSMAGVA